MLLVLWPPFLIIPVATIPQTWPPRVILLLLWPSYLKHGLLELYSSFCGHHTSNMDSFELYSSFCGHHTSNKASSSYAPPFMDTIPQTWTPWVILLVLWTPYLKLGLIELYSSLCGQHTSNYSYVPRVVAIYLAIPPYFVAIIPQTWPPRVILLILWPSYLKHGFLELCSSFCDHHSSNMATIPQTWPPQNMLLVLWPTFLKHGFLDLYSFFCGHHTSNMDSSSYTLRFVAIIPQTRPPRVMLFVL